MKYSSITYESLEDWAAKGKELFGEDQMKWKFECPSCGNVASVEDFKRYKEAGATPNSAYQCCVGRFTGGKKGPNKCDWAAFGLFRGPNIVKYEGEEIPIFRFAGELKTVDYGELEVKIMASQGEKQNENSN